MDPQSFFAGMFVSIVIWRVATLGVMRCPFCRSLAWRSQHPRCRKAYLFGLELFVDTAKGGE